VNRIFRVAPPFACGALLLCIQRAARGETISLTGVVLSYLWFLWALAVVQIFCLPFKIMVRLAPPKGNYEYTLNPWHLHLSSPVRYLRDTPTRGCTDRVVFRIDA
jgi:hypothetical protein